MMKCLISFDGICRFNKTWHLINLTRKGAKFESHKASDRRDVQNFTRHRLFSLRFRLEFGTSHSQHENFCASSHPHVHRVEGDLRFWILDSGFACPFHFKWAATGRMPKTRNTTQLLDTPMTPPQETNLWKIWKWVKPTTQASSSFRSECHAQVPSFPRPQSFESTHIRHHVIFHDIIHAVCMSTVRNIHEGRFNTPLQDLSAEERVHSAEEREWHTQYSTTHSSQNQKVDYYRSKQEPVRRQGAMEHFPFGWQFNSFPQHWRQALMLEKRARTGFAAIVGVGAAPWLSSFPSRASLGRSSTNASQDVVLSIADFSRHPIVNRKQQEQQRTRRWRIKSILLESKRLFEQRKQPKNSSCLLRWRIQGVRSSRAFPKLPWRGSSRVRKSILHIPGMLTFELSKDMFDEENSRNIRLYVRCVLNDIFGGWCRNGQVCPSKK